MLTQLTDLTQTQTLAQLPSPSLQSPPALPPPPPPEAILESRIAAAAQMRRPVTAQQVDAFSSKFAPWAARAPGTPVTRVDNGPKAMTQATPEPPMFTVPIAETKLDTLRTLIGVLAGRIKATTSENPIVALFGATQSSDDPFVRATRIRGTTGSSLSFGQRAIQSTKKTREGGAYLVLQIETNDARMIELRIAVQRMHPQSGRTGSFLEVIGTAPLSSTTDIDLIDGVRQRLTTIWGRSNSRP